ISPLSTVSFLVATVYFFVAGVEGLHIDNEHSKVDRYNEGDLCNSGSTKMCCFVGRGLGNNPFPPRECGESESFCCAEHITINGKRTAKRGCGNNKCSEEGVKDVAGGKRWCCKGRLCNVVPRTFTDKNAAATAGLM
ncbi:hypothetical protein PMAYCL1PPCAC_11185, partial [Pristionchus mayeri]